MKKINHINQYLLERYPNVWNTRIVWMLLLGLALHIIFFFIGFVSHVSPGTLQHTRAVDDYFSTGLIFVHVIISILMIVGWLVFMLKNNAFKSFYPSSGKKLFFEFVQYFIIIFVSTTFYFSYMSGFQIFVNYKYDDEKMEKNVSLVNNANAFLSQELELYTLENRLYPKEFSNYYCETDINKIDKNQKYFVYHNRVYQYFSTYKVVVTKKDKRGDFVYPEAEKKNKTALAYFDDNIDDKARTYFFKIKVQDLSPLIKSTAPAYCNFSSVFYDKNNKYIVARGRLNETYNLNNLSERRKLINKKTVEILNSGNSKDLEKLLQDFLNLSNEFDIRNNLNAKDWTAMIYHPEKFEVKQFIKKYKPENNERYDPNKASDDYYNDVTVDSTAAYNNNYLTENGEIKKDTVSVKDFNPNVDREVSPKDFFAKNMTGYYYYTSDLKLVLENIDEIKMSGFFAETVHLFLWIAFSLAALIFSFRLTSLRSLLFSIVSGGVIILAVTLFCVFFSFVLDFRSTFFIFYTIFVVGLIILMMPFFTLKRFSKLISSIFIILSIIGFPLFIWLIFGIINEHQISECRKEVLMDKDYVRCEGIIDHLGLLISYLILILSFIFIYFYTAFIKKWKALPE